MDAKVNASTVSASRDLHPATSARRGLYRTKRASTRSPRAAAWVNCDAEGNLEADDLLATLLHELNHQLSLLA